MVADRYKLLSNDSENKCFVFLSVCCVCIWMCVRRDVQRQRGNERKWDIRKAIMAKYLKFVNLEKGYASVLYINYTFLFKFIIASK